MKYNLAKFIKIVEEKYHEPFEILEYNGTAKRGRFRCGYCQEEYHLAKMGILLRKERKHICPHCFLSAHAIPVLQTLKEKEDLEFIKFGYREKSRKPTVIYTCHNCQEINEKPLVEFLKYPTCIHCGFNAKRKTARGIQKDFPEEFSLVGEYFGHHTKTLIRHNCGFIFKACPGSIISGHTYCPKCARKASKGERKIMNYLTENGIDFFKEKTFEWSEKRRYDFYLPDYNLLLEYHGQQHYKEVPTFQLSLEEQQQIDIWKEKKAKENGVDFFVISYLDFDKIETLLAQRLKENA